MRLRHRLLGWILAFAGCLVSLSLDGAVLPAAAQSGGDAADLTIVIRASNLSDMLREAIDAFARERQISVEYVVTPGSWPEHYEQMLLMHVGGLPFDVAFIDQTYVPSAAQGVLTDLTPFIERDVVSLDDFVPLGVESFHWNGAQYALPSYVSNLATGYNRSLFAAAGLPDIPTDWDSDEFSWNDFVEYGRKLTVDRNGDGVIDQYALRRLPPWRLAPFMFNGDWIGADGQPALLSPAVVESIERVAALTLEHDLVIPSDGPAAWSQGIIGMDQVGQFTVPTLEDYDWEYGVGVLPEGGGPGTRSTILYADGFAIGARARRPDLAWEFIKAFTMDPDLGMVMPRAQASVPAYRALHSGYLDEVSAAYPAVDWAAFSEGLYRGRVFQIRFSPNFVEIEAVLEQAISDITSGVKSTASALREIDAVVRELWQP